MRSHDKLLTYHCSKVPEIFPLPSSIFQYFYGKPIYNEERHVSDTFLYFIWYFCCIPYKSHSPEDLKSRCGCPASTFSSLPLFLFVSIHCPAILVSCHSGLPFLKLGQLSSLKEMALQNRPCKIFQTCGLPYEELEDCSLLDLIALDCWVHNALLVPS